MVDKTLILRKLSELDEYYRQIKEYEKIVSSRLFNVLQKMAKFRNIVVHHYDRVDAEIVVGILKKDLRDFTSYKDTIVGFLKSDTESGKQKIGKKWEGE